MLGLLGRYARWLHTGWPAGTVEKLPLVDERDGSTNVPGLYVVGDLTGIPLLKFSADTGARAVQTIAADASFQAARQPELLDVVIVGGGVSGMAAALEAKARGLRYVLLEAAEPFSTIVNFPRQKPIYTYPTEMEPAGALRFTAEVKEPLVEELRAQTRGVEVRQAFAEQVERAGGRLEVVLSGGERLAALRVIVAIGRSGNFRSLGVPGEDLDKVSNRLHDPRDFAGQQVLVVGGGDSACEAAIALVQAGAHVRLSYRKPELTRPKPGNVAQVEALVRDPRAEVAVEEPSSERVTTATGRFARRADLAAGSLTLALGSELERVEADTVTLVQDGETETVANDYVFAMIGREAPLDFFRRSGVRIRGEWTARSLLSMSLFLAFCVWLYNWKSGGALTSWWQARGWFPFGLPALGDSPLLRALDVSVHEPGFYYSVAYCLLVLGFGVRRIRRRRTPYVTAQTAALTAFQWLPLFLLPYVLLPWLGNAGAFDAGWGKAIADELFPAVSYGHGREYWRAFGFVLAWPLFVWNVFTSQPMWGWLGISLVQTCVLIPLLIWRWGKGAYCGWICSCGALAETLGDDHRQKMPHGPRWNRLNLLGQGILALTLVMLLLRITGWLAPSSGAGELSSRLLAGEWFGQALNYKVVVDLTLAGILGVGLYFWLSGRVWCRFACPLAALMHIYARFSQFRILADKKRCISCNVCTSVCHQGIDVMNFANKGLPMADPECVRCSACVQSCPTGVLEFGRVGRDGQVLGTDRLPASPVQMREGRKKLPVV
ncbi:MAG: NAD(P)-binding domain-containing protein [Planctomycetota bacterium]